MVALSRHGKYLFPSGLPAATYLSFLSGKEPLLRLLFTMRSTKRKAMPVHQPPLLMALSVETSSAFWSRHYTQH